MLRLVPALVALVASGTDALPRCLSIFESYLLLDAPRVLEVRSSLLSRPRSTWPETDAASPLVRSCTRPTSSRRSGRSSRASRSSRSRWSCTRSTRSSRRRRRSAGRQRSMRPGASTSPSRSSRQRCVGSLARVVHAQTSKLILPSDDRTPRPSSRPSVRPALALTSLFTYLIINIRSQTCAPSLASSSPTRKPSTISSPRAQHAPASRPTPSSTRSYRSTLIVCVPALSYSAVERASDELTVTPRAARQYVAGWAAQARCARACVPRADDERRRSRATHGPRLAMVERAGADRGVRGRRVRPSLSSERASRARRRRADSSRFFAVPSCTRTARRTTQGTPCRTTTSRTSRSTTPRRSRRADELLCVLLSPTSRRLGPT